MSRRSGHPAAAARRAPVTDHPATMARQGVEALAVVLDASGGDIVVGLLTLLLGGALEFAVVRLVLALVMAPFTRAAAAIRRRRFRHLYAR